MQAVSKIASLPIKLRWAQRQLQTNIHLASYLSLKTCLH